MPEFLLNVLATMLGIGLFYSGLYVLYTAVLGKDVDVWKD